MGRLDAIAADDTVKKEKSSTGNDAGSLSPSAS